MKRPRDFFQAADGEQAALPLPRADVTLVAAIMEEAKRRGIELTADPDLLAALANVQSEEEIPRELYAAIAAVLSWVDGLQRGLPLGAPEQAPVAPIKK